MIIYEDNHSEKRFSRFLRSPRPIIWTRSEIGIMISIKEALTWI